MLTPSLEDYIEEIYNLSLEDRMVRAKELADRLNVSMPAVTKATQRLDEDGYVIYRSYGKIALTSLGKELGAYLKRRNSILGEFIKLLGVTCDAELEVESFEHYISPDITRGIDMLLGFLTKDGMLKAFTEHCEDYESDPSWACHQNELKQMRRFGGRPQKHPQTEIDLHEVQ